MARIAAGRGDSDIPLHIRYQDLKLLAHGHEVRSQLIDRVRRRIADNSSEIMAQEYALLILPEHNTKPPFGGIPPDSTPHASLCSYTETGGPEVVWQRADPKKTASCPQANSPDLAKLLRGTQPLMRTKRGAS